MWTEIGVGPDPRAPPLGPLNLTPVPREAAATLPPLALVFDATEMHRGVASRLVSRGFPVAWHSNNPDSTHPLRGTRARTPRHAAEIAAYLPRGASRGGGGQPHHATARAGRAAVRALEALAADRPESDPGLLRSGESASPRGASFADASDPVDDARVDDALRNPLVVVLAVGGDAAMETALERLLAGERGCSSAYVDRNLLAGSVLIATGPLSDVAAGRASRRCRRAGVRLVAAALDGDAADARAGALHVWCAASHASALDDAAPVIRALARTAEVVGADVRDAASARVARAVAGRPRDDDGVAALRASGAAAAAVAAERRCMMLERRLEEISFLANDADRLRRDAAAADTRALEADARAVAAMESNATLREDVATARAEVERLTETVKAAERTAERTAEAEKRAAEAEKRAAEAEKRAAEAENAAVDASKAEEDAADARGELAEVRDILAGEMKAHREVRRAHDAALARLAEARASLTKFESRGDADSKTLRAALDVAETERDAARRDARLASERVDRLVRDRDAFDETIRASGAREAEAESRVAEARRRAEKAEAALKISETRLAEMVDEARAAESLHAATRRERDDATRALASEKARRSAERAAATEEAERRAEEARAAAEEAKIEAESRARRATEECAEARRERDAEAARATRLEGDLSAARDDARVARAHHASLRSTEARLATANEEVARLRAEMGRLETVVTEAHAHHAAVVAAAKSAAEGDARRAREDAAAAERARAHAEAAGYRAAAECERLAEVARRAEEARVYAEEGEERARRETAAERAASAAAHAALADVGEETARLAGEIDQAREAQTRVETNRRRARELAAREDASILRDALEVASKATPSRSPGEFAFASPPPRDGVEFDGWRDARGEERVRA